jgi:DNA-binding transcriptional ArsR family regulator
VERRKVGRIVYYRLDDDHLRDLVLGAASHVAEGS